MSGAFRGVIFLLLSASIWSINSCKPKHKTHEYTDTPKSGSIHISVDESFKPVIEAEIEMYEASYPGTKIIASYKPEAECLKDLFFDTATRMVIVTRGLHDNERKFFLDSLHYVPANNVVALDAVVLLVNEKSKDSLFSMQRLKDQLQGKINRQQQIIFDGLTTTSTVRFIEDSVLKGQHFDTSVVKGIKGNQAVIDYVATHENAIGLVGFSWIGNPEDTQQVAALKKVKIAYVQCDLCKDSPYVKPMQESIESHRYPLVRGLFYIVKEGSYLGLGTGFSTFMKYERGQLIFKRAYLGTVMPFGIRDVKLNQKIPKD